MPESPRFGYDSSSHIPQVQKEIQTLDLTLLSTRETDLIVKQVQGLVKVHNAVNTNKMYERSPEQLNDILEIKPSIRSLETYLPFLEGGTNN